MKRPNSKAERINANAGNGASLSEIIIAKKYTSIGVNAKKEFAVKMPSLKSNFLDFPDSVKVFASRFSFR